MRAAHAGGCCAWCDPFGGAAALVLVLIEIYGHTAVRDGWERIAPAVTAIKGAAWSC